MNLEEWKKGLYILNAAIQEINDNKLKENEDIIDDYEKAMIKQATTENDMHIPFE